MIEFVAVRIYKWTKYSRFGFCYKALNWEEMGVQQEINNTGCMYNKKAYDVRRKVTWESLQEI